MKEQKGINWLAILGVVVLSGLVAFATAAWLVPAMAPVEVLGVTNLDALALSSSTDPTLKVNQTSTGDLLVLQDAGTEVFAVADGGALSLTGDAAFTGDASVTGDLTMIADTTGGNAGAKNEFIGLPRVTLVATGAGTNGTVETVEYIDTTPTGEWVEVDGGTNIAVTADTSIYKHTTNSVKIAFTAVVDNEGVDGTITQDDLSGVDSVGFWIYSDVALTSGDFDVTLDDTDGTDQVYVVPAVVASIWTWVELDISGCDTNCDTTDGVQFSATAQGVTNLTAPNVYLDGMYKWDVADEEAMGVALVQDGVINVVAAVTLGGTHVALAEFTDYFTHYETGSDFIVWITDQSANDALALVAY